MILGLKIYKEICRFLTEQCGSRVSKIFFKHYYVRTCLALIKSTLIKHQINKRFSLIFKFLIF